jgi:rhodanese-related sulfurtransferase|tara:strand:+ start:810 stop:1133 length:324 start_codon:yes stop_codon:yes gene_type:complete
MVIKVDKSQEFVDSGQKLISEYPPLKEKPVTIYSDSGQESHRACQLVAALGGKYVEYLVDNDFTTQQFQMEFGGDASYPQLTLDGVHLGSLKEALHFLKEKGYLNQK